jgi:hypothetical protein
MDRLLKLGSKKWLQLHDIFPLPSYLKSETAYDTFKIFWNSEKTSKEYIDFWLIYLQDSDPLYLEH